LLTDSGSPEHTAGFDANWHNDLERASTTLTLYRPGDPNRAVIEEYIRTTYSRVHGASIRSFMPLLLSLCETPDTIIGAVGYRPAAQGRLFLERYLNRSVEAAIASTIGQPVERTHVVEIGNLACRDKAAARRLMWELPRHLIAERYVWLVFTATRAVRSLLGMFQAPLIELCHADASRAADSGDDWGRYYDTDPRVMAGYLPSAFDTSQVWWK
jgi:hypothetical protein